LKRAATFIILLFAALIFPVVLGGAGEMHDGAPPRLLEWPMLQGESLGQLASLIYPGDAVMQRRFITAAVRENPATFSRMGANQVFDQETLIWLPDLKELSQLATAAETPRHYLHPVLPAMQPSAAGAQPSRLQLTAAIDDKPRASGDAGSTAGGVELTPAPAIRHMNAMPTYDSDAAAAIAALLARNLALKQEQQALDARIAVIEANLTAIREALARDRRRVPRRARSVAAPAPDGAMTLDSLLSPSPLHLLTATGILLAGGGLIWMRRRAGKPVTAAASGPAQHDDHAAMHVQEVDFGAPVTVLQIEENFVDDGNISVDEIASIVEEAKIFVALGRTEHAIEVLEDYITTHPGASANPWLYLMDIYRSTRNPDAFANVAKRFHQAMNVIAPQWENSGQTMMVVAHSLEEFPHILARLSEIWGKPEAQDFISHLLQDNRGGERQGFSMEVLQEILLLLAILEKRDHLPPLQPF